MPYTNRWQTPVADLCQSSVCCLIQHQDLSRKVSINTAAGCALSSGALFEGMLVWKMLLRVIQILDCQSNAGKICLHCIISSISPLGRHSLQISAIRMKKYDNCKNINTPIPPLLGLYQLSRTRSALVRPPLYPSLSQLSWLERVS